MTSRMKRRLLVVEDDDSSRESVRRILTQMEFDVVSAGTLADGMNSLEPPPEIVLVDLTLPDGPGEQILARIQAEQLPSRVVVCTGETDEGRLDSVRRMRPSAILRKPISLAELVTACRR